MISVVIKVLAENFCKSEDDPTKAATEAQVAEMNRFKREVPLCVERGLVLTQSP